MDIAELQHLDRENPWPGLMPFDEAAHEFFHGRDDAVAELARRVRRELLTVLFGKSGLGKTSLLNAGLFPVLRAANFLPIYLRLDYANAEVGPAEQIKDALAANLVAWEVDGRTPRTDETLWGYFHDKKTEFWSRRNHLMTPVLVLDQFEEIFTLGQTSPAAATVIAQLAALIENRPPEQVRDTLDHDPDAATGYDFAKEGCKIVLALREDFLPEFEGLREHIPSIMNNRMRLSHMNGLQAREAILRSGGHVVDEAIADSIIGFVAASHEQMTGKPDGSADFARFEIEPALLSIVCRELNNKRQYAGQNKITADLLDGAQSEIVADFYKSSLADLDPAVKLFIEERLLTEGGYRDSEALADALAVPGMTRAAVDLLVSRRLLRIEDRSGQSCREGRGRSCAASGVGARRSPPRPPHADRPCRDRGYARACNRRNDLCRERTAVSRFAEQRGQEQLRHRDRRREGRYRDRQPALQEWTYRYRGRPRNA
jgi:hypothetical protein